jgi:hypothetical protein
MSDQIQKFKSTVPVVDLPDVASYIVPSGVSDSQSYAFPATSHSNSSSSFQLNVPSPSTILDRRVIMRCPVRLTFTKADTGTPVLREGKDAFRAQPLDAICSDVRLAINGLTISNQPRYTRLPLLNYMSNSTKEALASISPVTLDEFSIYSEALGATNSPFNGPQQSSYDGQAGRASYPFTVLSNTNTSAVIEADLYSYVKLAPFIFGDNGENKGLANVNTLTLNFQWTNLARMWSRMLETVDDNLTSLQVELERPTIYTVFYNAGLDTVVPSMNAYNYANVVVQNTQFGSVAPQEERDFQSSSFRFDMVPSHIYLWVGQAFSDIESDVNKSVGSSDAQFSISQVDILWDNRSGNLAAYDPAQLYKMSVENGLQQTWPSFAGKSQIIDGDRIGLRGSILKIEFSKDIALKSGNLVGMSGVYNFSVKIRAKNNQPLGSDPIPAEMFILEIQEGLLSVGAGTASSFLGVLNSGDFGKLEEYPEEVTMADTYGGSFLSKLSEVASKAPDQVKKACKMLEIADKIKGEFKSGGSVMGGAHGGAVRGGRSLSSR